MKNKGYKMYKGKRIFTLKKRVRITALFLLICLLLQIAYPTTAWALTSGPQQPEASNFTPADVSNLVDPFTGDFSYNIPMFEIGGYPVNLSYNSGVTMDQEATWVGLGWNLNTGAITRDVRGLPDDFWGDEITRDFNTKKNITAGGSVAVGFEFVGFPASASYGLQMKYNNYAGFSVGQTLNGGVQLGDNVNIGLGLSTTNGGLDINPNISFSAKSDEKDKANYKGTLGFGLNINSRTGLSQMSLNASVGISSADQVARCAGRKPSSAYSASVGGGGSISFLNPTYTPQNTLPYENYNFSGSFKIGGAVVWADISGTIAGFYSEQRLATHRISNPGYGYIYSEKGQFVDNATHDFNREKDGPFTNNTPTLPLTNYTYDAFNIKAQGIGGSFRGFRNDMGHVFDPDMVNPSVGGSFGAELDLGNAVDFGIDVNVNWNESKSGKWKDQNPASNQLKFTQPQSNSLYENVFFKMVGEKVSETDNGFMNRIQQDKAVAVGLENEFIPMTLNQLKSNTTTNINNNNFRTSRLVRNTSIQCFTVAEVKRGFAAYAKYLAPCAKDHHIALVIATTADGTRYVFGLPAYNKTKREATFAVGGNIEGTVAPLTPDGNNLVDYNSTTASIDNPHGIDNYYDVTETPAYVYTWYLTEVLSPDYSDLTGDGASPDDLGGYVKFNYGIEEANGSISPNIRDYKWRTPSSSDVNQATYSEGLKSITTDQKGTYLYGVKDIWYPSTIESKTQLVKFEYTFRRDGFGVTGEHGVVGGTAQSKINKINIYSRQDYVADPTTAIPLKTIHFEYDYSLCGNTANNNTSSEIVNGTNININKGKLTLKKVYFTYRNSNKAKYSAYTFEYPGASDPANPDYDPTANDRWGGFRSNDDAGTTGTANKIPYNQDYPYTYQDKDIADDLAACWNLKAINLPTGGKINIEYESDDYAYVQDKKACRMFQIVGAGDAPNASFSNKLFAYASSSYAPNNYLFFKLENEIPGTQAEADAKVKQKYFSDPNEPELNGPTRYLYFRFLLNANNGTDAPANEYVSGYADVSDGDYCGVWTGSGSSGPFQYGWVKLKGIAPDGGTGSDYHPISKSGWSFSRINTPFYANNQPTPGQSDPGDFLRTILNADILAQLIAFFQGPNNKLREQGFASEFVVYDDAHPEKGSSWIRLYDPDGFKLGGGHRVKKIRISDNWDQMEGTEDDFEYGQEYVYTNEEGSKSSGVASFEPMYGADENPFRIPVFYNKEYGPLIPDDRFYQEEPFGESFFPSPVVGYSRVKIMNLQRENVTQTATGYTVKEFYTAKDFPTKTTRTELDMKRAKIDPILAIFSPYTFDFMTNSQGFCIELNDMHGKPRREAVYQENNDLEPISYVNHFYKLETNNKQEINNNIPVLEKDGNVVNREIGTEVDIVADFRENNSRAGNVDIGFNTDYMQFGPIPLIVLAIFPKIKLEDTRYRSSSVTKVVNRYGIEVKTEAFDLGSKVMTENMLFNGISGEPLSTKVNNEYEDDRYTLSTPAYWAYPAMGHGSNNEGFVLHTTNTALGIYTGWRRNTGKITFPNADDYFEPGDECIVYNASPDRHLVASSNLDNNYINRVWVARDDGDTTTTADDVLFFIDQYGEPFIRPDNPALGPFAEVDFKVVRSGHRNILSPKIAEFATLEPPVTNFTNGAFNISNSSKVLSVTAQTFHEQWKSLKRYNSCLPYSVCQCTPNQFAIDYLNLIQFVINHQSAFVSGSMPMWDLSSGFQNGFTQALLDYYLSQRCSTITNVINVQLYSGDHVNYTPGLDPGFLSGTDPLLVDLNITGTDSAGDTIHCVSLCKSFGIKVVDISAIPDDYFNPTPGINCTDPAQTYVLYLPVNINGNVMALKIYPLSTPDDDCGGVFRECNIYEYVAYDENIGDPVNPYIKNILGKWRPHTSYTFIEDRTGSTTAQVNLRDAGYMDGYTKFWEVSGGLWQIYGSYDPYHWKRTTTMTQYHPSGPQIEEKNALDIYSAAQYGYFEQLAVAVAQNAQYKEIGFDGFEDYDYLDGTTPQLGDCSKLAHFKFDEFTDHIVSTQSHSGKRSIQVESSTVYLERQLQDPTGYRSRRTVPYQLMAEDLSEFFGPLAGGDEKKFVFSFWVKQANYSPVMFDFTNVNGDILLNASSILSGSVKKSPIIDGWQKFEYLFIIPASASGTIKVELVSSGGTAYFDDVRIHPFNSMMKSYVYDPLDLRFMAELDENNYATFYEYDEDGALVRVKKETERGIMTIQENRYGSYKY